MLDINNWGLDGAISVLLVAMLLGLGNPYYVLPSLIFMLVFTNIWSKLKTLTINIENTMNYAIKALPGVFV